MGIKRKPLQGVWNIIRFNRQFYIVSIVYVTLISVVVFRNPTSFHVLIFLVSLVVVVPTLISLIVSWYVYDFSNLYKMDWISLSHSNEDSVLNIHAGFDETSSILKDKFPKSQLFVFDFYDPAKNTEISIERARNAYPPFPGTLKVEISNWPLNDNSVDKIFVLLTAHEIRNEEEKLLFFKELNRIMKPGSELYVLEHLRDLPNFLAYNVGFFHFFSRTTWVRCFELAQFKIEKEFKLTAFLTCFILKKNGTTS